MVNLLREKETGKGGARRQKTVLRKILFRSLKKIQPTKEKYLGVAGRLGCSVTRLTRRLAAELSGQALLGRTEEMNPHVPPLFLLCTSIWAFSTPW